ncbi:hypothetical protein BCR42DRAFT_33741 [Absidia repens]|uniref:Uncharacterized protein n=1 Tax=Absidia repens TaxID=90262 RepID=A0A1X2IGX2_9FUNG|nr:hypothetical protein BCR42DRAFT_33741 [Absidia repens]
MHKDLQESFGGYTINMLEQYLDNHYDIHEDYEFSMTLCNKVARIMKDAVSGKLDRDDAAMGLLGLKSEANNQEFRIIKSMKFMIELLPQHRPSEEPNEMTLCSRYLNAFLLPLFDDPKNGTLFQWDDSINPEVGATSATISRRRPDNIITVMNGEAFDYSRGYGEVKCHTQAKNKASIAKDLVQLGVFAKNCIDVHNMKAVLTFQAIGRKVTFFITKLMGDGVYTMYEIGEFNTPGSLQETLQLLGYFDNLHLLLHAYDKHCVRLDTEDAQKLKEMKRATLPTPDRDAITKTTTNNKRRSISKHPA